MAELRLSFPALRRQLLKHNSWPPCLSCFSVFASDADPWFRLVPPCPLLGACWVGKHTELFNMARPVSPSISKSTSQARLLTLFSALCLAIIRLLHSIRRSIGHSRGLRSQHCAGTTSFELTQLSKGHKRRIARIAFTASLPHSQEISRLCLVSLGGLESSKCIAHRYLSQLARHPALNVEPARATLSWLVDTQKLLRPISVHR